jgi:hypothetical protein
MPFSNNSEVEAAITADPINMVARTAAANAALWYIARSFPLE